MVLLIVLAGWVFSLTLHEWAHARVALAGGDVTVRAKGYLSFNPIRYMDPFMSVILPIVFVLAGGIALPGGLVYVRTDLLRGPGWAALVSLAGPAANVACALACAAPFALGLAPTFAIDAGPGWVALAYLGHLQIMAIVLNMIPVPPLDGFGVIEPWLSPAARASLRPLKRYGMLAVILVLWFVEPVRNVFFDFVTDLSEALGLPLSFVRAGRLAMRL